MQNLLNSLSSCILRRLSCYGEKATSTLGPLQCTTVSFEHWLSNHISKTHFPYNAICMECNAYNAYNAICKHIHPKQIHIQWKNIFSQNNTHPNNVQHTDIFYYFVLIFNNKKWWLSSIILILIPTKESHPILWKNPCTEDVLTLFPNTGSNTRCQCFYFNKNTKNFESLKTIPIISKITQSSLNKAQSFISLIFISLRKK